MTKPTYGFNKLVGVKIATVEIAASGCRAVLIDENGVTYTLTSPGEMSVTKSTPRKPSTPKIKQDQEVIIEDDEKESSALDDDRARIAACTHNIEQRLVQAITEVLDNVPTTVTGDMRLVEDLNADSLDFVEIIISIEDNFNIAIDDEHAEAMCRMTLSNMAHHMYTQLNVR